MVISIGSYISECGQQAFTAKSMLTFAGNVRILQSLVAYRTFELLRQWVYLEKFRTNSHDLKRLIVKNLNFKLIHNKSLIAY